VNGNELKQFTCPVDELKCPTDREITLTEFNKLESRQFSWDRFSFIKESYCKYRIAIDEDSFKVGKDGFYQKETASSNAKVRIRIRLDKQQSTDVTVLVFSGDQFSDSNSRIEKLTYAGHLIDLGEIE